MQEVRIIGTEHEAILASTEPESSEVIRGLQEGATAPVKTLFSFPAHPGFQRALNLIEKRRTSPLDVLISPKRALVELSAAAESGARAFFYAHSDRNSPDDEAFRVLIASTVLSDEVEQCRQMKEDCLLPAFDWESLLMQAAVDGWNAAREFPEVAISVGEQIPAHPVSR